MQSSLPGNKISNHRDLQDDLLALKTVIEQYDLGECRREATAKIIEKAMMAGCAEDLCFKMPVTKYNTK